MTTEMITVDGLNEKEIDSLESYLFVKAAEWVKDLKGTLSTKRRILINGTEI